jgi:hexosaminidase
VDRRQRQMCIRDSAGHPFEAHCGRLRELGRTFLVAPGTSTWQSFTGRLDNALTNQQEAVDAARRHGAAGVLLTCWGDNGHHQPWPTNWPAMAAGLVRAWSGEAPTDGEFVQATAILGGLGRADAMAVAAALTHLGRLEGCIGKAQRNRSLTWDFLTATEQNFPKHVADVSPAELRRSLAHLDEADRLTDLIHDEVVREELRLGADLARAGLERALGEDPRAEAYASLAARHRAVWLRRSRPGGLDESMRLLFGSRID